MNAIDCPYRTTAKASEIKAAGYGAVIRYISPNSAMFANKRLTAAEAATLHCAGLKVGMVYERNSDHEGYFTQQTHDVAVHDPSDALAVCADLAIPKSVPVFFAVDYDASHSVAIQDYFQSVHDQVKATGRLVGVYGSGSICEWLEDLGLVHYTWLAQSRGWAGFEHWKGQADIVQGATTKVAGLDVDLNVVHNEDVLWG